VIRCALLRGEPELDPASFLCPEEAGLLGPRAVAKRRGDFQRGRFIAKKLLAWCFPGTGTLDHSVMPDDRGVPIARDGNGECRPVSLSITHTFQYAAAAVVEAPVKVGIDAERAIENRELVTANFYTERENALVLGSREPARVATTIWSAKEAVTKAIGEGLRVPLLSIEVRGIREPLADGWREIELGSVGDRGTLPAWAWSEGDCVVVVALSEVREGLRPRWVIQT
jgi:phosphopantetheinyl transferase (holo-ACP synthase)